MTSVRKGNLLVLSAPSGGGKTTILQKALSLLDEIDFSVSYTTRVQRLTERDGLDYHFVTEEVFREKIEGNQFLEWAEVHGNLYGTGRRETEAICESGRDVLLDVDVQGAAQVREAKPDAVTIFMLPPSFEVLEKRLRGRQQDSPEAIEKRLQAARSEIGRYLDYDYVVINEEMDHAADMLRAIILAERGRPQSMEGLIRPIFESFQ